MDPSYEMTGYQKQMGKKIMGQVYYDWSRRNTTLNGLQDH